jgi:hypothetical protein
VVDGRDQTDRFIDAGIWEQGFDDDRIATQVRSMRLVDRIAINPSALPLISSIVLATSAC